MTNFIPSHGYKQLAEFFIIFSGLIFLFASWYSSYLEKKLLKKISEIERAFTINDKALENKKILYGYKKHIMPYSKALINKRYAQNNFSSFNTSILSNNTRRSLVIYYFINKIALLFCIVGFLVLCCCFPEKLRIVHKLHILKIYS